MLCFQKHNVPGPSVNCRLALVFRLSRKEFSMNIASNDSIRLPVSATSTETAAYPNGGSPVSVHIDVGISPLYQRIHWHKAPEINLIQQGK